MGIEGRRSDRVKIEYDVKMQRLMSQANRVMKASILNLSVTGCKLKTLNMQTGFAVGESIIISFKLADFSIKVKGSYFLKVKAQVRWALPDGSEVGCKFEIMDDKKQNIFNQILQHLMKT